MSFGQIKLGPTWSVVRLPAQDRNRGDQTEVHLTEYALLAGVRDSRAFGKVLDSIATQVKQYFRDSAKENDKERQRQKETAPPILALERLPAPDVGYLLTSPARLFPWLDDEVRPTILVGKSFVAWG